MKRIGVSTFGGDGGKSGISQYIINLLLQLPEVSNSYAYDVLMYEDEKHLFHRNQKLNPVYCSPRIRPPTLNLAWHQFMLPAMRQQRKWDLLFLPAANRRVILWANCPMVGVVHDFSSIHVKAKYDPARMFYITRVLPVMIKRLAHILTVSESSKRDIVEYASIDPRKVTVTPLAADHDIFYLRDKEKSMRLIADKYHADRPYILFSSRIEHPGKNHFRLIQAFNLFKSKHRTEHMLVMAGSDWMNADVVHAEAERSPYRNDIIFTGFVPSEDLPDLYNAATLYVFPSLFEGFGLPILEAMCCGAPVACSNLSSMPEVAGDAALLFNPYEPESIGEAFEKALLNPDLSLDLAQRGLERCKQFTWRETARKTVEIFNQCLQ